MTMGWISRHPGYYFGVAAIAVVLIFAQGYYIYHRSVGPTDGAGWSAESGLIIDVEPDGPTAKAGLRKGDRIVALDGISDPEALKNWLVAVSDTYSVGDQHTLTVLRDGRPLHITYQVESNYRDIFHFVTQVFGNLVALIFLTIGLGVFFLKPQNRQVLLFCLAFTAISSYFGNIFPVYLRRLPLAMGGVIWFVQLTLKVFALPLMLHFLMTFPKPLGWIRRWRYLTQVVYIPSVIFWPLALISNFPLFFPLTIDPQLVVWAARIIQGLPIRFIVAVYFVAGLLAVGLNYRAATSPDHKRRMRVIMVGTLIGFVPLILFLTLAQSASYSPGMELVIGVLIVFFPLSFAYAIIKHRLFDLRLVIRRSLQYALARNVLFAALISPLAFVATDIIAGHQEFLRREFENDLPRLGLYLLVAIVLVKVHRPVMNWLDHKFFREAYDARKILSGLVERIGLMVNVNELTSMVMNQIDDSMHIKCGALLLRDPGGSEFRPVKTIGSPHCNLTIPLKSPLVEALSRGGGRPLDTRSDEARQWLQNVLPEHRAFIREAEIELLIPLHLSDEIIGFILLGEKRSEEPYSKEDRELLMTVAAQTAFGMERARLSAEMAKEEKLKRELEIAQQVQARLFPQSVPHLATLDIAGYCLPAEGVAGDYYDFLPLGPGRLGVAIGDISGKGISAALLMANVQASLRSQAAMAGNEVAKLLSTVNGLLYRSTSINNYSTLFYATYDEAARRLIYANAGHNGPVLIRHPWRRRREPPTTPPFLGGAPAVAPEAAVDSIERLETGGTIIGAFESPQFQQETVQLDPGDLVVAYTDGITEAQSVEGDVYGEEGLEQVVLQNKSLPASEIIRAIMEAVSEFARGADQRDDMTLVVMKVL